MQRFQIKTKAISLFTSRPLSTIKPPKSDRIAKYTETFLPSITNEQHITEFSKLDKEYTCWNRFLIGGSSRLFFNHLDEFNEKLEPLLFSYRNEILHTNSFNPSYIPAKRNGKLKILFLEKEGSDWLPKAKRNIYNLEQVVEYVKNEFSDVLDIVVIQPHKLSLNEQMKEVLEAKILVSPAGGVSMIGKNNESSC